MWNSGCAFERSNQPGTVVVRISPSTWTQSTQERANNSTMTQCHIIVLIVWSIWCHSLVLIMDAFDIFSQRLPQEVALRPWLALRLRSPWGCLSQIYFLKLTPAQSIDWCLDLARKILFSVVTKIQNKRAWLVPGVSMYKVLHPQTLHGRWLISYNLFSSNKYNFVLYYYSL